MAKRSYRSAYPRIYRTYREHGLGEPGVQLTKREVRAAAELAGFTPGEAKQMEQISEGESSRHPGIRGDDPGGTKGWGLVQNTPGVWGQAGIDYMNKLGGERALRNPVKNMKMAKFLYDSAGKTFSPWYGTRYLQDADPNAKSVLGKRGPQSRRNAGKTSTLELTDVAGVDNSALRAQVQQSYLQNRGQPGSLLELAAGLQGAQDVPGTTKITRVGKSVGSRGAITADGTSVDQLFRKAKKWAHAAPAYLWGGGHGAIAKVGDRVDCSGFVSAMTGLKAPQVASQFKAWGKPGKGRHETVYASDGHVFMSIRRHGKERFFGTSNQGSNAGGGVTEFHPSPEYLKGFVARHPG